MGENMKTLGCGRRLFLSKNYSRTNKTWTIQKIVRETLLALNYDLLTVNEQVLKDEMKTQFENFATKMAEFEKEAEFRKCLKLMKAYILWEQGFRKDTNGNFVRTYAPTWTPLATQRSAFVTFSGVTSLERVDALVDRGDHIEAIRYKYGKPQLKKSGYIKAKTPDEREVAEHEKLPRYSTSLAKLYMAGKALADDMGLKKPVYASQFHLQGRYQEKDPLGGISEFERQPEENIVSYSFSSQELKDLAADKLANPSESPAASCNAKLCQVCGNFDLCKDVLPPRKLKEEELPEIAPKNSLMFTDDQEKVMLFKNGVMKVSAIAGSGKTTVMVLRTLDLIESGTPEKNILMITFSEKATRELRDRMKAYAIGAYKDAKIKVDKIEISTFNAFGQKIIDKYYRFLGFSEPPTVVDETVKCDILTELADKHRNLPLSESAYREPHMSTPYFQGVEKHLYKVVDVLKAAHVETSADVQAAFAADAKNGGNIIIEGNASSIGSGIASEYLDIFNEYNDALMERNMLDYEDQLRLLLQLADAGVFADLPFEHIIVDEFQDSNPNQIDLITRLVRQCKGFKSLCVVGDSNQAIYAFRNATKEVFDSFDKYFPNADIRTLADNFRSGTPINRFANKIIESIGDKVKIVSHSKEPGSDPKTILVKGEDQEMPLFLDEIKKRMASGTKPSDIAILARTKKELLNYQAFLEEEGIPTILKVPATILDEDYPKAVLSTAAFLSDSNNRKDLAFYVKMLGEDPFDLPLIEQFEETIKEALEEAETEEEKIQYFNRLIQPLREDFMADELMKKVELKNFHTLNEIISYLTKYEQYSVRDQVSTKNEAADAVNLITIHSAKGLEWDTVLLSLKKFRTNAEDERLLYVGATRAKNNLLISFTDKQRPLANTWTGWDAAPQTP